MKLAVRFAVLLAASATALAASAPPEARAPRPRPENVIFMIGDGMGFGQLMLGRLERGRPLTMETMPVTGLVHTAPAGELVTDSAAAATALASGKKTKNEMCGVTPDGARAVSILEEARDAGMGIGFVSTGHIAGATAAGFLAHVPSRADKAQISRDLLDSRADVLAGAGDHFDVAEAKQRGVAILHGAELLRAPRTPVLAFLEGLDGSLPPAQRSQGISLAAAMRKAIALLQASHSRYFLVVEEDGIDSAGHDHDIERTAEQVATLDEAVAAAVDIARADGRTLVAVTADHETGGLQLTEGTSAKDMVFTWSTDEHTGGPVPIYAYGPGSEAFAGVLDNTEVHDRLRRLALESGASAGSGGR